MPKSRSRLEYLRQNRSARAWAALDRATNDQMAVTYDPCMPAPNSLNGKHVVVIGAGVGGLTTAYELLSRNDDLRVTILEARERTGGRCMTLRTGDTLIDFLLLPLKSVGKPSVVYGKENLMNLTAKTAATKFSARKIRKPVSCRSMAESRGRIIRSRKFGIPRRATMIAKGF